jgi:cation diffusion facilitator family transporter
LHIPVFTYSSFYLFYLFISFIYNTEEKPGFQNPKRGRFMALQSINERQKKIRSITLWGVVLNVFLMGIKFVSGVLLRSSALIADGVHSFSDLATDFVVLIGTRLSSRPADKTHPYGHGKLDTIASILIALVLVAISFGLIWSAGISIYQHKHNYPGYMLLVVASISVVSKEILFHLTRKVSRITQSTVLYANAWHHRSDSFSSFAVLLGGVASLLGWGHADQVATVIVGFMIIGVGGKILFDGLIELSEHSADRESIQKIEDVLSKEADISSWHALRTRKLGAELFIDVHVLVDPALSVQKSHDISTKIEEKIKKELSNPSNILVHIEPDTEEMRKP